MFTGIVQAVGQIVTLRSAQQDRDIVVRCPSIASKLSVGGSVALDGVCQTVTASDGERFEVHAIAETLRLTTLGRIRQGQEINLELPLGAGDPIGGHFVQGHVDGMAEIEAIDALGQSLRYAFRADPALIDALVPKGSVAIDGISLTLGPGIAERAFEVFLIPHTLQVTTLGRKRVGDAVNVETDVLGKYVLRYLRVDEGQSAKGRSVDELLRDGWGAGA